MSPCDFLVVVDRLYASNCANIPYEGGRQACETAKKDARLAVWFLSQGGNWTPQDREAVYSGVVATAIAFVNLLNNMGYCGKEAGEVFRKIFGIVPFIASSTKTDYFCERTTGTPPGITCYANSENKLDGPLVAHELGHLYNAMISNNFGVETPYNELSNLIKNDFSYVDDDGVSQKLAWYEDVPEDWYIGGLPVIGKKKDGTPILGQKGDKPIKHNVSMVNRKNRWLGQTYVYSPRWMVGEEFADMFTNWVNDGFTGPAGIARNTWITNRLRTDMLLFFGPP